MTDKESIQGSKSFKESECQPYSLSGAKRSWEDVDKPDSHLEIRFPDGARFQGTLKDGVPIREGSFYFPSGEFYSGCFADGLYAVSGRYQFADGSRYSGSFSKGVPSGWGHWYSAGQLDRYDGNFSEGQFSGSGTLVWANTDTYEGKFRDGMYDGQGEYRYRNGDILEGEWSCNRLVSGRYVSGGTTYVGDQDSMVAGKIVKKRIVPPEIRIPPWLPELLRPYTVRRG